MDRSSISEGSRAAAQLVTAPTEERFERLVRLAARALDAPVALFNLIGPDHHLTKAAVGWESLDVHGSQPFCEYTVSSDGTFMVADATIDDRFCDTMLVRGSYGIRFYAGCVVRSPAGTPVGTICVLDRRSRTLDDIGLAVLRDIADLVEVELARPDLQDVLARNERLEHRFAAVFARPAEALILLESDGTPIEGNDVFSRLLGYPPRTVTAFNYRSYVHGEDLALLDDTIETATFGSRRPERMHVRLRSLEGTWRWFEIWVHDLSDDPSVGAVLLSARDVSENLEVAAAQKEAHDRLDAALRVAQNGFLEFDGEGNLVDMNDVVWQSLAPGDDGVTNFWDLRQFMVDATGRPFPADYSPIADAVLHGRHLNNEIVGLQLGSSELPGIPKDVSSNPSDGGIRWLSINTSPLSVAGGQHTIVSVQDVTPARMLERELARQHRRYELIFEHATDILAVIDGSGRLMFSSPSTERVLGHALDDHAPGGLLAHVHPDDRNIVRHVFTKVLANTWDAAERVVIRAGAPNGEWVYLEATATNLLLEPSIKGILITARDVTSREMLTQALAHQALRDPLTGIFNRRAFSEGLERSLARAVRSGGKVALLWLDLDDFKAVNDNHGHAVGDAVLVEVARRLGSTVRAGDVVGRFGGDEFVIVLEPIDELGDAVSMANRVVKMISAPIVVDSLELRCNVSVGIAMSNGEIDQNVLLARSDAAMYEAKRAGGERVAVG